jgi:phytoene dehydrogenase-like protein
VNTWELPAAEYFKLVRNIAPLRFGYVEGGSIRLWERMADVVRERGGAAVTGCAATSIQVTDGCVTGVTLRHAGRDIEVTAPVVISNLGPHATVTLAGREAFEHSYVAHLDRAVRSTAILWLHFASDERVLEYSAIAVCGTRRVNMIDEPSADCAGIAPPGKHLYTVGGAPLDALNPGDLDAEFEQVMLDLRDIIPGFDTRCRVLTKTCFRGKWPGFRTMPGSPASHRTPVKGLFNVGDACCPRGYAGSMGAAKSAMLVRDDLRRAG